MLGRDEIAALIPHKGTMCLLERVIEWDQRHAVLTTTTHRALDNPLRLAGRLRAIHLCEYGAQAMAVHCCLLGSTGSAKKGFLVSLRDVRFHIDYVGDLAGELRVTAECLLDVGMSWQYAFEVRHDDRLLAQGRAAAIAPAS